MSMKTTYLTAVLTSFIALSAYAQTAPAPAPEVKGTEATKAEKPADVASATKKSPALDKSKHYHPRDGGKV